MSSKKTHSSHALSKTALRLEAIEGLVNPLILDAFSANGDLWRGIAHNTPVRTVRIEKEAGMKGVYLKGDNLKWMRSMDLSKFDVIDLDAYGSPHLQLDEVFRQRFTGRVVCTWIVGMAGHAHDVSMSIGLTKEMLQQCPTLTRQLAHEILLAWLYMKGIREIRLAETYETNKGFARYYFWFQMPKL